LETGGGIFNVKWFFDKSPFIVYNVDIISSIDLKSMYEFHLKTRTIATLAVRNRVSNKLLLFNKLQELVGIEDLKNNTIKMINSEENDFDRYAFSGIHIISPKIFELYDRKGSFSIIDTYMELISKGAKINAFNHNESNWFDIGTNEKLKLVENYIKNNTINVLGN